MVTRSQYRSILVLKPPPGGGRVGRPSRWPRRNSSSHRRLNRLQLDVLRAAQVHVLAQQRLEERAGMTVLVEDQGAGGLDLPHRQLPPVPGVPVGVRQQE